MQYFIAYIKFSTTNNTMSLNDQTNPRGRMRRRGMGTPNTISAPAAISQRKRTVAPRIVSDPSGGVTITNEESLGEIVLSPTGVDGPAAASFAMQPSTFPWLGGVAEHFQHYSFLSIEAEYRPLAPTAQAGAVTVAPYYEANDPVPSLGANVITLASLAFIKSLPGAEQFAVWAAGQIKAKAMEFLRKKYRQAGDVLVGSTEANDAGNSRSDESKVPGYFLVGTEGGVDSAAKVVGNLWVKYKIKLTSPYLPSADSLAFGHSVTDSSALDLQNAQRAGNSASFLLHNNTITFNRAGSYVVWLKYQGSTPLPATDGFIVKDRWGRTRGSEVFGAEYDRSAGTLALQGDSNSHTWSLGNSAEYLNATYLDVNGGDVLHIPSMVSGTMTQIEGHIHSSSMIHFRD